MKKRIIGAVLAALCLCSLLCGCGGDKTPEDGAYSVEVTLTGGSGRASLTAEELRAEGGSLRARVVWSSPYYEYMLVGGQRYEPVQESGNSTFEIPVVLDEELPVTACTVAMSQPHEIEYTLFFDSRTLKEK